MKIHYASILDFAAKKEQDDRADKQPVKQPEQTLTKFEIRRIPSFTQLFEYDLEQNEGL